MFEESERDWPEVKTEKSFSGIYLHFECWMCKKEYSGYKNRIMCYKCHQESELSDGK